MLPVNNSDFLFTGISCMKVLRMFGNNENIVLSMNKECRNISILHMSNWIEIFNVKMVLDKAIYTFYWIVDLTKEIAIPLKIESPPPYFSASYFESFSRLVKGESKTTQPISWLTSAYIRAVAAPILLPQIPILLTVPRLLRYLNTQSTSSLS
jgi:hypothetical protein